MKIGLLGGAFDPVHRGHLLLAKGAQGALALDQILWIPTGTPPHRAFACGADAQDRARMVELAIEGHAGFKLSRIELERSGPSYSIDTVRALQKDSPDQETTWFFLVGSDAAKQLSRWCQIDQLKKLVRFVVIPRPGAEPQDWPDDIEALDVATCEVSASQVRERIKQGKPITDLVSEPVARYIEEKGLYR